MQKGRFSKKLSDYMDDALGQNGHLLVYKKLRGKDWCEWCNGKSSIDTWCSPCCEGITRPVVCQVVFENNSEHNVLLVFSHTAVNWERVELPPSIAHETYTADVEGIGIVTRHTMLERSIVTLDFESDDPVYCTIFILAPSDAPAGSRHIMHKVNWRLMDDLDAGEKTLYFEEKNQPNDSETSGQAEN